MDKNELAAYAQKILDYHNKKQPLRFSEMTTDYLESLTECMLKKEIYKETIEILSILQQMDDCAHVCAQMAECYK